MKNPFVLFWGILVLASIAWYAFLVFYVGIKAGRDIQDMTKSLKAAGHGGGGNGHGPALRGPASSTADEATDKGARAREAGL